LSAHASVPAEEFAIRPGDLLLAMEFRQLAHLRALPGAEHAQFDLLGRYGGKPHLHDPYGLSAEFTATSLSDIARSVDALAAAIERARTSR
jgi:protein-tyrosine-phosphatase